MSAAGTIALTIGTAVVLSQSASGAPAAGQGGTLHLAKKPSYLPTPSLPTRGPSIDPSPGALAPAQNYGNNVTLGSKALSVLNLPNRVSLFVDPVKSNVIGKYTVSQAWVVSNPTTVQNAPPAYLSFGQFPAVTVSTLAFGILPVTVTVRLSQALVGNYLSPLTILNSSTNGNFVLSGNLNVALSDLTVDGRPLNLDPRCSTVTPARLIAYATPDEYQLFTTGGRFSGNVVVPAFRNCGVTTGSGPESLDALLNGTLSGSTNPTFLSATLLAGFNPNAVGDCAATTLYPNQAACALPQPTLSPITGPTTVPSRNPSDYPSPLP